MARSFVQVRFTKLYLNIRQNGKPIARARATRIHAVDFGRHLVSERLDLYDADTGRGSIGPHPFARQLSLALGAQWAVLGRGEGLEVSLYDRSGRLARIFRGPAEDLAVTETVLDLHRADESDRLFAAVERLGIPLPPALPAFTELHLTPDGHIWVKRFQLPGDEGGRWGVFSPDGAFLGHVETPPRFTVYEIGDDHLLGAARDELDVQRVLLYRLAR